MNSSSSSSSSTPLSASSFGSDNGKPGMEVRPLLQREESVLMEVCAKIWFAVFFFFFVLTNVMVGP